MKIWSVKSTMYSLESSPFYQKHLQLEKSKSSDESLRNSAGCLCYNAAHDVSINHDTKAYNIV